MMRSPCTEIIERLQTDAAFFLRYEVHAEQTLKDVGYRLSEDEALQLAEWLMQEVIDGRRSEVILVCPCSVVGK
ncbi:MAG TPA: hypothetical protein VIR61_03610 [Sulfuricaulis sp.]